ncbi:transporter substrate-binding domain-containing protein [Sneathiella glossodoripedis]|uniref:transporter substrate-binding domain-containing protein n=1 Tax=Sneathiella glossodoripedis TaxID=418853 RepID=UPI000685E3C6|nr:transporter substrate-binding domain-containing protein [Sneathiella glossodoripedis]
MATTLKEKGLNISSIADLGNHKVVAFAKASIFLGDEFAKMAEGNKNYREVADQVTQNKLLMTGRTEAVVGDIRIFKYYNKQIEGQVELKEVTFHQVFEPTNYHVAFKDASLRDDFNAGLKEIKRMVNMMQLSPNMFRNKFVIPLILK